MLPLRQSTARTIPFGPFAKGQSVEDPRLVGDPRSLLGADRSSYTLGRLDEPVANGS